MSLPKLKYDGIQALLEHQLRNKKGFAKTLLVNRLFLNIANSRNVYRLHMEPHSYKCIYLRFQHKNVSSNKFALNFESFRQILSMLKPPFLAVNYLFMCLLPLASALELIGIVDGKVRLYISSSHPDALLILKGVWHCLDELECSGGVLSQVDDACDKKFDRLDVWRVENNDQLFAALRQSTYHLKFWFYGRYSDRTGENVLNNDVKQCCLSFEKIDINQISPIIHRVLTVCTQLERLDISYYKGYRVDNYAQFFETACQQRCFSSQIMDIVRQLRPNLQIMLNFIFDFRYVNFELTQNWRQQLRNCNEFKGAKIEEQALNDGRLSVIVSLTRNDYPANMTFKVRFWYKAINVTGGV